MTARRALDWFASQAEKDSTFLRYLSNTLSSLPLPSLYLYSSVVAVTASSTVLDAMSLMSDEGVSSVAVTVGEDDRLLSTISVTDIAKVCLLGVDLPRVALTLHPDCCSIWEQSDSFDARSSVCSQNQGITTDIVEGSECLIFCSQEPDGATDGVDKYPGMV